MMRNERSSVALAAFLAACGCAQCAWASLPPVVVNRVYSSSTLIEGSKIASPFDPGAYGGPGFNSVAVNNSGGAYVHVNLWAEPPPPLPLDPIHHSSNQALLFTGASGFDTTPFLFGGAGYGDFWPTNGVVTAPSADYTYDSGYCTAVNNNGVGAFGVRLIPRETNLVTPITGVYFGKTAMPIKAGDVVTAAGVAPGTVFGDIGPTRLARYPDYAVGAAPLTSNIQLNDNNVFMVAGVIVEGGQSKRAIFRVAVNASGVLLSETLVAKEGGPVGSGPSTWVTLLTTPNTCAINNAGDVIFSGITSTGVSGIYKANGSGVGSQFVAVGGGATPVGSVWAPLAGAPVDLSNGGQFVFRGIVQSNGSWSEVGDAGETFGSQAGFFTPTTNVTQGGGDLSTISGTLANDSDVDVYQIKIGDPTLPVQQAFSATTVPDAAHGFAGANFDTVLWLFAFNFANNSVTRVGVGRCDDAAAGVVQSTLTTASLQSSTHQAGDTYFLAVTTPKAHAVNRGLGAAPFPEMWQSVPGQIVVSDGIAYWVDAHKGQIGRADVATGTLLSPLQVGVVPQQMQGYQGPADPNSKILDQKLAVYSAGANSKIYFQQHAYSDAVTGYASFRSCNLDGTGVANVVTNPTSGGASAMAFDSVNSKFYYAKTITGGSAQIYRCDPDGSMPETVLTLADVGGFGESYIVESIAIDTAGTGKVYWVQTIYDTAAGVDLPGYYIRRANLDGTSVQTLASNARATSLAIDGTARRLYYTSTLLNKVSWIDMTLAGPSFPSNLLVTTAAPRGVAVDSAAGKAYWSNPSERIIRRSATVSPSIENWLPIGADIGEVPSDGPAYLGTCSSFARDGVASGGALPYQIKLTGATFMNQGAVICKNGTTAVAQVGQTLPGTSSVVTTAGLPNGPVRISDAGTVAWIGTVGTGVRGLFLNSENVVNSTTVPVEGGVVGTVDNTFGAMDMSSNGQYIVLTSGDSTLQQCIKIGIGADANAGACCDSGGACQSLTAAACSANGGSFLGVGAACVPDPCPQPGACCITATQTCFFALQSACSGSNTWVGGTSCSPNPCVPQDGACCCGSHCSITTAAACAGPGKRFTGAGVVCGPYSTTVPCCRADYNKSNPPASVQDIFDFLSGYFSNSSCADTNDSGGLPTVQDIFDFLTAYFGGGC